MATTTERVRVRDGITFLRENHDPRFHEEIDIEDLDIINGSRCVLGQLYGDFFSGREALGLTGTQAIDLGFDSNEESWEKLNETWKEELLALST